MKATKNRFKTRTMRVLFHLIPSRIKRLILIASLSGKLTGKRELDRQQRTRLQKDFNLCTDCDAIGLPLAFSDKIWTDRPIESRVCQNTLSSVQCETDLVRLSRQIVVMMPCWLVYDKMSEIIKDVKHLIADHDSIFA